MKLTKDCDMELVENGDAFIGKLRISKHMRLAIPDSLRLKLLGVCLLIIIQTALSATVLAATYYVDPAGGSDTTGNGSNANPWKTVGKAKSVVIAGDIVNLLPGSYGSVTFGDSGDSYGTSWDNPIIYRNNPGSAAYSAQFSRIVFKGNHNFYTIVSGVDVYSTSGENCICIGGFATDLKDCAYVRIENCRVHGSAGVSGPTDELVYVQSSTNILIEDCEVYNSGSLCWGVNLQDSEYVTVSGCHIHDIARSALTTGGGQNYTLEYNHIHTQHTDWGIDPHASGISIHSHKTTIRGNIVYDGWNTRTIRFYQSYAGPDGYRDMLVENNVFYDGQNWSEFIDLGPNCVFRNNTFGEYVNMVFAQNADGSGLSLYNNVFAANFQLRNYSTSINDSQQLARSRWDAVHEGNNIFTKLVAPGNGYLWIFPEFSATSNSLVLPSLGVGTFFESRSGSNAYQLCEGSAAIDFADSVHAPATDVLGNSRVGLPDAGCYEYGSSPGPVNQAPTANAGQDQTVIDADGNGSEQIVLDGSASSDSDGTIASYVWTESGTQIATGVTPTVSLSSGQHTITLTITDDGGLTNSDTVTITVVTEDETAPSLVSVTAFENAVEILFSETLDPFSVGDIGCYDINNGLSISQAALSGDGCTVILTTSEHTADVTYTLICGDIADLAGNIMAETAIDYIYDSDLAGWWRFDEAAGTVAQDSSGTGNTGTLVNGPAWTDWALTFDGVDDYVDCGGEQTLNFTGSLTISACIRPQSFGQGGWGRIVDKGNGSTGYSFYLDSASSAIKYVVYGGNTTSSSTGAIELNKWQHVAVVYDESAGAVNIYVDGEYAGTTSYSTPPADSSNSPLVIGIRGYDLGRAFDGLIDNVRLYDRPLNADEVLDIFNEDYPFGSIAIGDKQVDENSNLTFEVITQLPDTLVEVNEHNLPTEPGFTNNIFSWTPTYDDAGSYEVTFRISQGQFEEFETITITVNNVNRAPILEPIGDKSVNANATLTFTVNASDPDGDNIIYIVRDLPVGASLAGNTFNWTPNDSQVGTHPVTFIVGDGQSRDTESINITVNNDNRAPILEPIGDKSVDANATLTFTVNASDPDGDNVLCTVVDLPAGATFAGDTFNWTPNDSQAGTHQVTFIANDGQSQDSESINITVNDNGVAEEIIVDNGDPGTFYTGTWSVSDAPNPYGTDSLWSRKGSKYTWTFKPTVSGNYKLSMWWTEWKSRSTRIPVDIRHAGGTARVYINQQQNGGKWNLLGQYYFQGQTTYTVTITSQAAPTSTNADAIKVTPGDGEEPGEPSDIIIDNGGQATSYTGTWSVSGGADSYGADSVWSRDGATYTWTFSPTASASYELSMWWTQWSSRSTSVPVDIEHSGGTTRVYINQQLDGGQWNTMGQYLFEAGTDYDVTITAPFGTASTCADAVRFTP